MNSVTFLWLQKQQSLSHWKEQPTAERAHSSMDIRWDRKRNLWCITFKSSWSLVPLALVSIHQGYSLGQRKRNLSCITFKSSWSLVPLLLFQLIRDIRWDRERKSFVTKQTSSTAFFNSSGIFVGTEKEYLSCITTKQLVTSSTSFVSIHQGYSLGQRKNIFHVLLLKAVGH